MKPGTKVMLNASLIDEKRQIQYLASLVWNKADFPSPDTCKQNLEIDQHLLQKYFDVNEIFAMDDGSAAPSSNNPGHPSGLAQYPQQQQRPMGMPTQQFAANPQMNNYQPQVIE